MKAFRTFGNTIKKPILERISNTIKTSKSMFRDNRNTIKKFASDFGKKRIPKYKLPYAMNETSQLLKTEGKKSFLMKSVGKVNRGKLGSLINMNFIKKMTTLIVTGNLGYAQLPAKAGNMLDFPSNIGNMFELHMTAPQGNTHEAIDNEQGGLDNKGDKGKKAKYDPHYDYNEKELKEILTPEQMRVIQHDYTEEKGTGKYVDFFEEGRYNCSICKVNLFNSAHKYKSDCGHATFWEGNDKNFDFMMNEDKSLKDIKCKCLHCNVTLGYVSEGGPPDKVGVCYKIYSGALEFVGKK